MQSKIRWVKNAFTLLTISFAESLYVPFSRTELKFKWALLITCCPSSVLTLHIFQLFLKNWAEVQVSITDHLLSVFHLNSSHFSTFSQELSWMFKWALLITCCPSSVLTLHIFQLFLKNWAECSSEHNWSPVVRLPS